MNINRFLTIASFVTVDAAVSIVPNGNSRTGNSGRFHRAVASGGFFFLCDVALGGGDGGGDGWWWWCWWWWVVVVVVPSRPCRRCT